MTLQFEYRPELGGIVWKHPITGKYYPAAMVGGVLLPLTPAQAKQQEMKSIPRK